MSQPSAVEALLFAALEKPSAAERTAFLDSACADNSELRRQVEKLLRAHADVGDFLNRPAIEQLAEPPDQPDATQAISASTDQKRPAMPRTEGDGSSDEPDTSLDFLQPSTRPDSLGRLGHYEVLQVLGRGGFGIVFRAFDETLQRVVALKVMAPQLAATSPARKRFLREARCSAQVRHENVVQVHEVAEQPLPHLAMEFIPGETLQQKLDRVGPLDVPETLRIGRQIAEGLAAAHATDLIHRDIKPGNVLLEGGQHKVKITDFGLARAADDASISQSGIIAGTPMYMAPEQAKGDKLDQRADLFSLGSVLYQMVAGRPPFRANSTLAVLKRVAEDTPRDIREVIPETPQWLCDIIAKLHAKNPDDRYQSAREVADVLADCEAQLKANAKLKDYSRIPRGKPRRSGRRKWVAAAAAVLLAVIALAVTEISGVTHLFRDRGATPNHPDLAPGPIAKADASKTAEQPKKDAPLKEQTELDHWVQRVAALPAAEQVEEVRKELMRRNPGFDGKFRHKIERSVVTEFQIVTDQVTDIAPIRVFNALKELQCLGMGSESGLLADLTPLTGMNLAGLRSLKLGNNQISDVGLAHFKDCKDLTNLQLQSTPVSDAGLVHFQNCKALMLLNLAYTKVSDAGLIYFKDCKRVNLLCLQYTKVSNTGLAQFKDMPLTKLMIYGTSITDLTPLQGMPLEEIYLTPKNITKGLDILRDMKSLKTIGIDTGNQSWPAAEFWERYDKGEFGKAAAPFTDADVQRIAALPAAQQVEEVRRELKRRNPGFNGKMETKIEGGVVTEFRIVTDKVTDIAPIGVFNALRVLECTGTWTDKANGQLADLTPLKGMNLAGLRHLNLTNTKVTDAAMVYFKNCKDLRHLDLTFTKVADAGLIHFKGCKTLTFLSLHWTAVSDAGLIHFEDCKALGCVDLSGTKVSDMGLVHFQDYKALWLLNLAATQVSDIGLAHLKDCKNLTHLYVNSTNVSDVNSKVSDAGLAHFKGMPLRMLSIENTGITDLTPLQGMPLEDIRLTPKNITRGLDILRDMKSLKTIGIAWNQSWPAAEFWERYDRGEFGLAPFTDADVQRIAALPAAEQVEEVRKELMRRNPGFDGKFRHKIERSVVTEFQIVTDKVTDIAPIRVWSALLVLDCRGTDANFRPNGQLEDLTPLKGMNLASLKYLNLAYTKVTDAELIPFQDCKALTHLYLYGTNVSDAGLAHFQGCKALTHIRLDRTNVSQAGLAHFKGCKNLTNLDLGSTRVSDADLVHFHDWKALTHLQLNGTSVSDAGLAHLKGMPLRALWIVKTGITDLTPLQGMALEDIRLNPKNITKGLDILREMKSLKTIGVHYAADKAWPAAEFWDRYDRGEFK